MNAILKFRKNKQVPKAQNGLKFVRAGTTTWGVPVWADTATGDLYELGGVDPNTYSYKGLKLLLTPKSDGYLGKEYKFFNLAKHIKYGHGNYNNTIKGSDYVVKKAPEKLLDTYTETMKYINGLKKSNSARPTYAANFAGMNFSEDEKNFMTNAGYNPNDARSVQEFILSQASGANLGARGGAGIADGYWGDKSKAAFQALRDKGIFAPKEPIVDAPTVVETPQQPVPVIDASDPFGYESKGNYSLDNASSLKTDGIRDWTTMMNYIKGNQNSAFSQDMMHRFGSDLSKWNQKDVESAMGVSGNYGRKDRSRIQGFMAGNQTAWNNLRQSAINDFAKNTFMQLNQGAATLGNTPGMSREQLAQSMEGLAW